MDPFTALGVAAAAVQFLGFAIDMFKEYDERQNQAAPITTQTFEMVTRDLKVCMTTLRSHPQIATLDESEDNISIHETVRTQSPTNRDNI